VFEAGSLLEEKELLLFELLFGFSHCLQLSIQRGIELGQFIQHS
jgi:hypothetical protein